jgi:two-component system, OmpR family, response regulator QseB
MLPNWVKADASPMTTRKSRLEPAEHPQEDAQEQRDASVLLIEPDESIAHMYELGLNLSGIPVRVADSRESAMMQLNTDEVRVIVMDLGLPRMSALEMLDELRGREVTVHVPVIVLSNEDIDFREVYSHGANDCHVMYRTTPKQLVDFVHRALHAAA